MKLEGGCFCGAIRYRIDAEPIDAGYCHCRQCQKASGAPMVAWATLPFDGFSYLQGSVAVHDFSEMYQREHCAACGSQLTFRAKHDPATIDVTLCTLDDSSMIRPQYHIWLQSKAEWLHIDDGLPQFLDNGPDLL